MSRNKPLVIGIGLVLVLLLSVGVVMAQGNEVNLTIIRDSDSFTLFTPGGAPFSLNGMAVEVITPEGELVQFPLDNFPALALLAARPIPTELCVRLIREGTAPSAPAECQNVGQQLFLVQVLADEDVFWVDEAGEQLIFSLLRGGEFLGFCQGEACEFTYEVGEQIAQAPTEVPEETETEETPTEAPPTATLTPTFIPTTIPTDAPTATISPGGIKSTSTPAPAEPTSLAPKDPILPGDSLNETSAWGVSGRVTEITNYDSRDWENIVNELRDKGLVSRGSLVFNERGEVWRSGSGYLTVPLARSSSHENVVMGGVITFEYGDVEATEYCTLSMRMVFQNNVYTRFAGMGLISSEGETGLVYLDVYGNDSEDINFGTVDASLSEGQSYYVLIIAVDDTITGYINGQLAFEQQPLDERFGHFGLTLLGNGASARCEGENIWVYQFD